MVTCGGASSTLLRTGFSSWSCQACSAIIVSCRLYFEHHDAPNPLPSCTARPVSIVPIHRASNKAASMPRRGGAGQISPRLSLPDICDWDMSANSQNLLPEDLSLQQESTGAVVQLCNVFDLFKNIRKRPWGRAYKGHFCLVHSPQCWLTTECCGYFPDLVKLGTETQEGAAGYITLCLRVQISTS